MMLKKRKHIVLSICTRVDVNNYMYVGAPVLAFPTLEDSISSSMKGLALHCQVGSSGRTQISGFLHPLKRNQYCVYFAMDIIVLLLP